MLARLLSIQVGLPRDHGDWRTAYYKEAVAGPVFLSRLHLDGDGQADPRYHGGPDKAVLAYAADHYPAWREELDQPELVHGAFAENFTIAGLDEHSVCIGDRYQIGEAVLEVSQPRGPCWKIGKRWNRPDLTARVARTGRTGWYLRVVTEGHVQAGDAVRLLERPPSAISVHDAAVAARKRRS